MKAIGTALYLISCLLVGMNTYFALQGSILNAICIPLAIWSAWVGYDIRQNGYI